MRTRSAFTIALVLGLLALATSLTQAQGPLALAGTAFTYQGRLVEAGSPANGVYDLRFKLFDSLAGPTQIGATVSKGDVAVVDGLFTVALDFGAAAFAGEARYLEALVRPGASTGAYTALTPRQELTATPYALHAFSAPWAGLTGVPAGLDDGDDDTTYTAGAGLTLAGTELSVNMAELQARVSGACAQGSMVQSINADGTVNCGYDAPLLRALGPFAAVVTAVDTDGTVGQHSSITIGTDGLPLISYYDATNGDLKVLHCGNPLCNSGNTTATVDSGGDVGQDTSIAIGGDWLPVISYHDVTNGDLKVAHCGDGRCGSGNTITEVDGAGTVGLHSSLAIGADGLPVIAYLDASNVAVKVLHCGAPACNSGNSGYLVDYVSGETYPSLVVGADGLPVLSYVTAMNLWLVHCGNATCSSGNTWWPTDFSSAYPYPSLAIGADGLAVVAYPAEHGGLGVVHCGNLKCNDGNTQVYVGSGAEMPRYCSLTIGADGLPVISYYDLANAQLWVAHCSAPDCASGNSMVTVDVAGWSGEYTAITIGPLGLPVISYYDAANGDLKVLHCSNALCSPYFRRR